MNPGSRLWRAKPTWLSWSGGKDSVWALRALCEDPAWDVRGLIGLVNERNGRVILHGVRHELLERQAEVVGLPIRWIPVSWSSSTEQRNDELARGFGKLRTEGAECVAFGDRLSVRGRDRRLLVTAETGLEAVFPLWDRGTRDHLAELLKSGLSARICSVDTEFLPPDRAGLCFDADFVARLPHGVNCCGGNDEYHTFVEWAPGWDRRVPVEPTRSIEVYNFAFAELELVPESQVAPAAAERRIDPIYYFARLDRVRHHVDGHLDDDLAVETVARVAAMSASGFSRFFREHVGMTFNAWLAHHRVEHACRLLRENNAAVTRIGEAVGFRSERTFRRAFHVRMDCSPSEYRRRALEEAAESETSAS